MRRNYAFPLLTVFFVVSGATALAGQVVLNRLLTYVFGASHLATSTVLAAYMAGLALGSLLASRFVARLRRPVLFYGVLELGVAGFFAALPVLYPVVLSVGAALGVAVGAHPLPSTAMRFVVSFALVLIPTALMGATLPVLLSGFDDGQALRRRLPWLYGFNALGGAAGAFLSGYVAIMAIGLDGTALACAAANALIGGGAIVIGLASRRPGAVSARPAETYATGGTWMLAPTAVCVLAFLQGVLSFGLEVVWSHLIRTVIGVTTYAFTVMLTVILLGLGLGSAALSVPRRREGSPLRVFVLAQLSLSAAIAASLYAWDRFPDFVAATLRMRYEWSFTAREAMRFLFAAALLLPSGIALGVSLPALTASIDPRSSGGGHGGAWVGRVFGFNTLGAISGALLAGFVLLGRIGSQQLLEAAAVAAFGLALAAWRLGARPRLRPAKLELALASGALLALALFPGWNQRRLTAGKHYTWDFYDAAPAESLLLCKEDPQSGFITVELGPRGSRVMKTNGKYEGTDADVEFQDTFALVGAVYLGRFETSALLGLGPGRTLALLHEMPFRRVDVVEQSPAVLAAARSHFPHVSGAALADSRRVEVIVDDGRNHLQVASRRYDYVVVGITAAAFAGTGSLYNRDFFEIVRRRLAADGVFLFWVQIHHLFPADLRSVAFSMRDVFPHVHLYAVPGGQALLVASGSPLRIHLEAAARIGAVPRAARVLRAHGLRSPLDVVRWNVISREGDLQRYFESGLIPDRPELYTDLSPRFEFTAPMALAARILNYDFQPFASAGLPEFLPPLPRPEYERLERLRFDSLRRAGRQASAR